MLNDKINNLVLSFDQPDQRLGTTYVPGQGVFVRLWAPKAKHVDIEWFGQTRQKLQRENDYFVGHFPDGKPGDRYWFYLDDEKRIADPASRYQPEDVHGPSEVVSLDYHWTEQDWQSVPFREWVIYEVHVGTYSDRHDFSGLQADLPRLKELGINAIQILPIGQFPGGRNWGYDGVFPHAVQHSYGGPDALKELIKACHKHGIAVVLDVVYNHLGPEGNILTDCGPYATKKYHTSWGNAMNFDDAHSDDVRRYFLQGVWQWFTEYHFDGLRLDSVHMMFDNSPVPFMQDLHLVRREAEKRRGCPLVLIGEVNTNDSRVLQPIENNGFALDAHWADDLHNVVHVLTTGETRDYYADYGGIEQLAKIYARCVAYEGDYSPQRKRHHGRSYNGIDPIGLNVYSQNHDQIGNRPQGERLIALTDFERAKLAAACVLVSPFTPLLFMGEETASRSPFYYFVSHHDEELSQKLTQSRAKELQELGWTEKGLDPTVEETFLQSVWQPGSESAGMTAYYTALISLSKNIRRYGRPSVVCDAQHQHVVLTYGSDTPVWRIVLSFNAHETDYPFETTQPFLQSQAYEDKGLKSTDWTGRLAPWSATVWSLASDRA